MKNFLNEIFQVSVVSVPEVIAVTNRNFILDTKNKSNEGIHIFLMIVNFAPNKF
jgi:hypothetical protein